MRSPADFPALVLLAALSGPAAVADVDPRTAPPTQSQMLEFPDSGGRKQFQVVGLGEDGFVVVYVEDSSDGTPTWVFRRFDTNSVERWSTSFDAESKRKLLGQEIDQETVYILLARRIQGGGEFELITLDRGSGALEAVRNSFPAKFEFVDFEVNGNFAWFAGQVEKEPFFITMEIDTGEDRRFPVTLDGKSHVRSISVDEQNDRVQVVVHNLLNHENTLAILTYSGTGEELERFYPASESASHQLLDARLHRGDDGKTIMIGTYSRVAKRSVGAVADQEPRWGAQGLFFTKWSRQEQGLIKYHSFTEFENFYGYLPEGKRRKKEEKLARKKEAGSEPKLPYRIVLHDAVQHDDAYVVAGELLKAVHEENWSGTVYWHAFVAAFDEEGERIWDHSFELGSTTLGTGRKVLRGEQRVEVGFRGRALNLVYVDDDAIESLEIRNGVAADETMLTEFELGVAVKNVKDRIVEVDYWYENRFLLWGLQSLKLDEPKAKWRRIFFVSRVDF